MFWRKDRRVDEKKSAPKSHFLLMGLHGEGLSTPIHIHYDTFMPAFEVDKKALLSAGNAFDFMGTFLVTLTSPNFGPKGHTCRVSGINHKLSRRGVKDGVIAHVDMVRGIDEEQLERVHVNLREDGSLVGLKEGANGYETVDLNEVYFSFGDTVHLDGNGDPFDDEHKPRPLPYQQRFMRQEQEKLVSRILDR